MPSRHIAANAANFAYRAKQNRVSTFSDGCVSNAAFLCGKIGYRRFLVRGCYCKAKTFSDGCVSNAAFLCGKIGYRRFLVRGCYNIKSSRCQPTRRYAVFCLSAKVFMLKCSRTSGVPQGVLLHGKIRRNRILCLRLL